MTILTTTCCIVGGGPAGMMLGYLLARRGVRVTVLEKHQDFNRDFRGDTVHPSTLELFYELGLLEEFLALPHQELEYVGGVLGDFPFHAADFRQVPAHCKMVVLMPQWDFLEFLSRRAKQFPNFDLRMEYEAVGLVSDNGTITGVEARTPNGMARIEADLVVGSDGRHSVIREAAKLEVEEFGVPLDVLWFHISRRAGDPEEVFGLVNYGRALVLINRSDYFQAGLIIQKGSFAELKEGGLEAFRETIRKMGPWFGDRVEELKDWDQIKLLTVQINRLRVWHKPGLLCIGDAAHAMSPAGGIGINLAIQDAVAAAHLLADPLLQSCADNAQLARVQRRREFPTRVTQRVQMNAHRGLAWVFEHPGEIHAPWQFKVVTQIPGLQRLVGRLIGIGVRPEHISDSPRCTPRAKNVRAAVLCGAAAFAIAGACYLFRRESA